MKILAIETATMAGGAALLEKERLIAECRIDIRFRHSERLLWAIDHLLEVGQTALTDIAAIAVSSGPGSYTGLRVGLATAKGLAMGSQKPLVMVPTLEAMAAAFPYCRALIAPFLYSRRTEVHWALFDSHGGSPLRLCPDATSSVEEALRQMGSFKREILFVGEEALKYKEIIIDASGGQALFPPLALQPPMASFVAEMGLARFLRGEAVLPHEAIPNEMQVSSVEFVRR